MTYHLKKLNPYEQGHSPVYAYTIKAFTDEEVDEIIKIGESREIKEATIYSPTDVVIDKKVRICNISWIERTEDVAWLFEKLEFHINHLNDTFYNFDLTNYEPLQYTSYDKKGSHYGWHTDCYYNILDPLNRKLSLSLFLSNRSDYRGGDFQYNCDGDIKKVQEDEKGNIIVFPSHLLHRVTPITKGVRKSLVTWVQGPHFK